MTSRARQILLALAAAAALGAGGCGSSGEEEPPPGRGLPQSFVDQLEPRLEEVQRRYDDGVETPNPGSCEDIASDSFAGPGGIDEIVAGLPQDVDPELRRAVERSIERLRELTEDCVEKAEANEPEPAPEPEPVPVEPVPEETVPEETTPEKTKPEKTTPEPEPTPPPSDDDDFEERLVPPGQDGGVPAPAPGAKQDKAQRKKPGGDD